MSDTSDTSDSIRYEDDGGERYDGYDDDTDDENDDTNDTTRHDDSEGSDPFELCAGKGKLGFWSEDLTLPTSTLGKLGKLGTL